MRLIDADALKKSIGQSEDEEYETTGYILHMSDSLQIIDNAPTIPAISVEWLREKMKTPCMTCANPFDFVLAAWQDEQKEQEAR